MSVSHTPEQEVHALNMVELLPITLAIVAILIANRGLFNGKLIFILTILILSAFYSISKYQAYLESLQQLKEVKPATDKSLGKKQFRLIQVTAPSSSINADFFQISRIFQERKKVKEVINRYLLRQKDVGSDNSELSDQTLVESEDSESEIDEDADKSYPSMFMENYMASPEKSTASTTMRHSSSNDSFVSQSDDINKLNEIPNKDRGLKFKSMITNWFKGGKKDEEQQQFEGLRPLKLAKVGMP